MLEAIHSAWKEVPGAKEIAAPDLETETKRYEERIERIQKACETPTPAALLYAVFRDRIHAEADAGRRFVICTFASTQRLERWLYDGDCTTPIQLLHRDHDGLIKLIGSQLYPQTRKTCAERSDVVCILVGVCSLSLMQIFSATGIKRSDDPDAIVRWKKTHPQHIDLKATQTI